MFLIAPLAVQGQEVSDIPGKVTKPYQSHGVTFAYPANWRVLDEKEGDALIGAPNQEWVYLPYADHSVQMPTRALCFGFYDGNANSLEGAAYELLGRFHQRFPSFQYFEDEHLKKSAEIGGREFFEIGFHILNVRSGMVIVTRYDKLYWYWLFVTPPEDAKEYSPTFAAITQSIQFPQDSTASSATPKVEPTTKGKLSEARTSREIAASALPSIVAVVMQDSKDQPVALGTGFYVRPGIIATNLHVIEGAAGGYAKGIGKDNKFSIDGVVGTDILHDLALISVSDEKTPALRLGDDKGVEIGDPIYCIGNPVGLEGTFSQGLVSGLRKLEQEDLIQITAPISPGSSGGPVLSANGSVVAIAVATLQGGQNLNFAIPASYLAVLIDKRTPLQALSSVRAAPATQGDDRVVNGHNSLGVTGTNFAWEPDHTSTSEYTLSLRNSLRESVTRVRYVVIFYDKTGKPIDSDEHTYGEVIPAGLAKRTGSAIDNSVRRLTVRSEIRVLDYVIADDGHGN